MNKIGIISGNGDLPLCIGKNLIKKNYSICFFCIKNFANSNIYKNFENVEIELTSFSEILNSLSIHVSLESACSLNGGRFFCVKAKVHVHLPGSLIK